MLQSSWTMNCCSERIFISSVRFLKLDDFSRSCTLLTSAGILCCQTCDKMLQTDVVSLNKLTYFDFENTACQDIPPAAAAAAAAIVESTESPKGWIVPSAPMIASAS